MTIIRPPQQGHFRASSTEPTTPSASVCCCGEVSVPGSSARIAVRAPDRVHKRELVFHRDAVEEAQRRLTPLLADHGLLVSEIGAALGISRKFSVPLLEHLDSIRFTRRVDDRRVLARP